MQLAHFSRDKTESKLSLIHQERLGDLLFFLGTLLAILSTYQAEDSVISKRLQIKHSHDYSLYTIATAS